MTWSNSTPVFKDMIFEKKKKSNDVVYSETSSQGHDP
jgi:hypothetical protein